MTQGVIAHSTPADSSFSGAGAAAWNANHAASGLTASDSPIFAGLTLTGGTVTSAGVSLMSGTQTRNFNTSATDYLKYSFTLTSTHASDNIFAYYGGAGGVTSLLSLTTGGVLKGGAVQLTTGSDSGAGTFLPSTDGEGALGNPSKRFGTGQFFAGVSAGTLQSGGSTLLTLTTGAIGMSKMTASGTAPGATGAKFEVVAGTNAGTAKLVMYAGTSGTATTIIDNVGAGVS